MKTQKGFTIVELLIVIVVIGILASITVVAFNGVQSRAKNAKKQSEMGQMAKAVQLYRFSGGTPVVIRKETTTTTAQIDTALATLGLSGIRNQVVVDTDLPVNDNTCRSAPMTKDKYCIAIFSNTDTRIVYWHDLENKWIQRLYREEGITNVDFGTGAFPDLQSY